MAVAASVAAEAVAERRERNARAAEAMEQYTPSKCKAKPIKNESTMESESHWSSMQL